LMINKRMSTFRSIEGIVAQKTTYDLMNFNIS